MGDRLEHRGIPARVGVRRAADDTVSAFECGGAGARRDRTQRAQQRAAIMPVDMGLDIQPLGVGGQDIVLHDGGIAIAMDNLDGGPMGTVLDKLDAFRLVQTDSFSA